MYGGGDPYRRQRPPMDSYGRGGGYGGYGLGGMNCDSSGMLMPGIIILSLLIAFVMLIAGFAAPYWLDSTGNHLGLWRICTTGSTGTCENLVGDANPDIDWLTATQALSTISLICMLLGAALVAYWFCTYSRYFFVKALIVALLFMSFLFMLVSIGIFGGNYSDQYSGFSLDWCFYLVCAACVLTLMSGTLLLCIPSRGSMPKLGGFRDQFGFGYGQQNRGYGGQQGRGYGGPPDRDYGRAAPPANPYGGYGGGGAPYSSGTLPFTSRY